MIGPGDVNLKRIQKYLDVFVEPHSQSMYKIILDKQNYTKFENALQTCFGKYQSQKSFLSCKNLPLFLASNKCRIDNF